MKGQFHLKRIEESLREFKDSFEEINDLLAMRRETVTENMVNHIVEAYDFLNSLLKKDIDLFTPAGLHALLEMNHIVLCGTDKSNREQYYEHLSDTRQSFLSKIKPIKDWVLKNKSSSDPAKLATGYYSRALSQPQLFIEGNHRTGNIILNYILISSNEPPYIISKKTARLYLDISGEIKFTYKDKPYDSTFKMPAYRKRFQNLLKNHTSDFYLVKDKLCL